jgi:hypothetical protein
MDQEPCTPTILTPDHPVLIKSARPALFRVFPVQCFKVQVDNASTVNSLHCESLNCVEKEKSLSRTPGPGQSCNLACTRGQNHVPGPAGGQSPFNKLTQNIFKIVTVHRFNMPKVITVCKNNFRWLSRAWRLCRCSSFAVRSSWI